MFLLKRFLCCVLLATSIHPSRIYAGENVHRLYILHSYEENHVCGQPQHDGVIEALGKAGFALGKQFGLKTFHMDVKRKNNTPELMRRQASLAMESILEFSPDILVTLDDAAFSLVGLEAQARGISVVFSGINRTPEFYDGKKEFMENRTRPGGRVTGVYEKLHIADAFRVHAKMFPDIDKIRVFVDRSPTGEAIMAQIERELGERSVPCRWDMIVVDDWERYKRLLEEANQDDAVGALYLAALLLKDRQGNVFTAPEIIRETVRISKKPEIALNYVFARLGLFGGAAVDFFAMGRQAGKMVARIMRGEPAGAIGIEEAERYALVFNLRRARELGIRIPDEILFTADELIGD